MSKSKDKGTKHERGIAEYLGATREPLHGSKDVGDVHGVELGGLPVVVECKNEKTLKLAEWTTELVREMETAGTPYGFVAAKRKGKADPGEQYALTTVATMKAILAAGKVGAMAIYDKAETSSALFNLDYVRQTLERIERDLEAVNEYATARLAEECFEYRPPEPGETFEEWRRACFRIERVPEEFSAADVYRITKERLRADFAAFTEGEA